MRSKVFLFWMALAIPCLAGAQQPPANSGAQAQGNVSAQGGASVQRGATGTALRSEPKAGATASASSSRDEKQFGVGSTATANAVLAGSLDAKKAKPGDPVAAKTRELMRTPHGTLPKGTKLLGRVTEAKAAGQGESESVLAFTFDRAVLRDGRELPIHNTVRALAAAQSSADIGDGSAMGSADGRSSMNGALGGAGSAVGGLGTTAGGALGTTFGAGGRVAGSTTQSLASTTTASTGALKAGANAVGGIDARGMLRSESQGVFGLQGIRLTQSASGSTSVISSAERPVRLQSGTRMLLATETSAAGSASATATQP